MATPEQIQTIMTKIHQLGPRPEAFARIQSSAEGAKAVMICLFKHDHPMSSKQIGQLLHVSSARMAVVVRSLETKGLIEKQTDPRDRRSSLLTLTEKGREELHEAHQKIGEVTRRVIDQIGYDRIVDCLDTIEAISSVMREDMGCPPQSALMDRPLLFEEAGQKKQEDSMPQETETEIEAFKNCLDDDSNIQSSGQKRKEDLKE